jgi:geranylgeranyl pyrophosphate synthase
MKKSLKVSLKIILNKRAFTVEMENLLQNYTKMIEAEMKKIRTDEKIPFFYDPIHYVIELKGKRVRPLMLMLTAEIFGADAEKSRYAAAAVELLHNFTLVHDDIMDEDDTRRGKATVHKKWDINAAILSGDGLMGLAFQKLLQTPKGDIQKIVSEFTKAMIVICEGQGLDKTFENNNEISSRQYLDMIYRKTAALIELSFVLGALIAEKKEKEVAICRSLGRALGMGFQIQDDILDIFSDAATLGKDVGSDFLMKKKTLLSIMLFEEMGNYSFFNLNLEAYSSLLQEKGIAQKVREKQDLYFAQAEKYRQSLPENNAKTVLTHFIRQIRKRVH